MPSTHINYIELYAHNLEEIKTFYSTCFGWTFTDYGPEYVAFSNSGLEGGFEKTDKEIVNGALKVLYRENLEEIKSVILKSNGNITKDIFSFPVGKRFYFSDPSGNELAIWSDKK